MAKQTVNEETAPHLQASKPFGNHSKHPSQVNLRTRKATIADIPFLATIEYEASLPPLNHCFLDDILPGTNTDTLQFIEAMLRADASNWGNVDDFLVLEEAGQPVAAATGFTPSLGDYRPLRLSRLATIAQLLGWSNETANAFRDRYEVAFGCDRHPAFFKPQAPWIIETVAVVPEARGRGLSKVLLGALLDKGRSQQHSHAGIMVINGNDVAQHTYESIGFKPYQSFFAEYFDNQFPGITKLRLRLN
ncbi:MAG: GNAT family N-acetyltransferase [Cyanobacteria bacterium P01_A01_bin.123]